MRTVFGLIVICAWSGWCAEAGTRAADLGKSLLQAGLDSNQCYRIRDISFTQEDAQFFLTDGYLILGKPVAGRPLTAVFSADVEGGDAEVLLLPPDTSERKSLGIHTGAPNLNEHFRTAVFFFSDATAENLVRDMTAKESRKAPEAGVLMAEKWTPVVKNLMDSFESRLMLDLLTPGAGGHGFFAALISGNKLGNFDILRDDRIYEQMLAGQFVEKKGTSIWNIWTSFTARSHRNEPAAVPEIKVPAYRIEGTISDDLRLTVRVNMTVEVSAESSQVIPLDLSGQMRALSAKLDGKPVEIYERESIRSGLVQVAGNELLLVVPDSPLSAGSKHELEIVVEGNGVVQTFAPGVYTVSSRGSWYPGRGLQFSSFDTTFRYPAKLQLVTAGGVAEDRTEGSVRITRRVATANVRVLGVNLGDYVRKETSKDAITVEAFANKEVEASLRSRPFAVLPREPQPAVRGRRSGGSGLEAAIITPPTPQPASALDRIGGDVADAAAWFASHFGPPPLRHLAVTPLPGRFGQGFPGMIYLSTLSYFEKDSRQLAQMNEANQFFFTDLMRTHEVAHQWWGNTVVAATYHHDWLMEALANYSALLYEESVRGRKVLDAMMEQYRQDLQLKNADGEWLESTGPLVQGRRLETAENPVAYPVVVYGKGTWVIHMLRRQLGDEAFLKMLGEVRRQCEWKTLDTDQFRKIAASYLPKGAKDKNLENFFDQWVYSTGIPNLKIAYTVKGKPGAYKLSGTITQTDVPDDFSVFVPVEVQIAKGKTVTLLVRTGSDPEPFSVNVPAATAKAILDPQGMVLKR